MATERTFILTAIEPVAAATWRLQLSGDTSGLRCAGQFVMVSVPEFYLRRPVSVCDCEPGLLTLIVKVMGEGTAALCALRPGREISLLCGLGNGFDLSACPKGKEAMIIGGGVGVAPLLLLCKQLREADRHVTAVLGFNTKEDIFLEKELEAAGADVIVATADGSAGCQGFVTDAIRMCVLKSDYFYACGPRPMLKALCTQLRQDGEVSTEERMGCGAGICYGCTCQTTSGPKRTCKEGPVFKKEELVW
ncbi:MAG: dihydroorotate dehydrogenase electron transfer subunit [Bacteroidales bacterium]|nr:dihydroorotate dehydrogenase electron transfer subunit [Bacteroidales bacterium]